MDFTTLWNQSASFRSIFIGAHGLFDKDGFEIDDGYALWEARKPSVEWDFCAEPGCTDVVQAGERCAEHHVDTLPTWKWYRGVLYRLMVNRAHRKKITEYQDFAKHVAWRRFGGYPKGFVPVHVNGNPFDFSAENIVVLSPVSKVAYDAGVIDIATAIKVDQAAGDIVVPTGGRKPVLGMFGYTEIANAAGVRGSAVRQASRRGKLNIQDLKSVVKFVKDHELGQ